MNETQNARFAAINGIVPGEINETSATAYIDVTEASLNLYGIIHGGLLFSLADNTAGMCAKYNNEPYVTLGANINYLEAISSGRITATANLIRRGSTTCIIDVSITSDTDCLLAKGTFTMYRLPAKPQK
jgi:acyl-CoA thioesterase